MITEIAFLMSIAGAAAVTAVTIVKVFFTAE